MKERKPALGLLMDMEVPVHFVIGKQDSRMPYDQVLAQACLPRFSEITFLSNAGHMGFVEEKEITKLALRSFALNCFALVANRKQ
jgi:pimeloyl-ACP methyl ester carboxylesterase